MSEPVRVGARGPELFVAPGTTPADMRQMLIDKYGSWEQVVAAHAKYHGGRPCDLVLV